MGTLYFHSRLTFCQWDPRSESINSCDQWCLNMSLVFFIWSSTCLACVLSCQEAREPHHHSAKPELKTLFSIVVIFTTVLYLPLQRRFVSSLLGVSQNEVTSACQRHQPSLKLLFSLIISTGNSLQNDSPAANLHICRKVVCWFISFAPQSEERVDNKL